MDWPKIKDLAPKVFAAWQDQCKSGRVYSIHDFAAFLRAEYGVECWVDANYYEQGDESLRVGYSTNLLYMSPDGVQTRHTDTTYYTDHDTALFAACLEGAKVAEGMVE